MTSNLPNIPSTPPSSYLASRLAQAQGKPLPAGEAIASFVRHDDALAAFDVLSEQNYPVTALYLVNDGIRQVEYPVQPGYGRALISAAIQGAVIGLVFSVLMTLAGDSFISEALKYVPLSVAVFVLWQMYVLRRSHGGRYPMRTEAIPSRTVMYALPEYAQDARRVLGAHPRFSAAVAAARAAAAPEASQARAAQSTVSMNGAPVPTGAPKAPSYRVVSRRRTRTCPSVILLRRTRWLRVRRRTCPHRLPPHSLHSLLSPHNPLSLPNRNRQVLTRRPLRSQIRRSARHSGTVCAWTTRKNTRS